MKEIAGIYAGEVVNLKDPEHRGRIKVRIAELLGDSTSAWCEPCVPCCFENGGDFCLPDMKDYVWVAFINGDIETPVYFGGWWSKDNSPLENYEEEKSNVRIISFGDMSITFDCKDNSITMSTTDGENDCEFKITPTKVTVNGKSV